MLAGDSFLSTNQFQDCLARRCHEKSTGCPLSVSFTAVHPLIIIHSHSDIKRLTSVYQNSPNGSEAIVPAHVKGKIKRVRALKRRKIILWPRQKEPEGAAANENTSVPWYKKYFITSWVELFCFLSMFISEGKEETQTFARTHLGMTSGKMEETEQLGNLLWIRVSSDISFKA